VDNPEMDYNGKEAGDNLVKYTYYKYNDATGDYDIQLAANPKEVGDYKLVIEFLGSTNYKPVTYPDLVFQIVPREMTITIPPASKLYDGLPWYTTVNNTNVNPTTAYTGLAPNQTLYDPLQSKNPRLYLLETDAGEYHYSTTPKAFGWDNGDVKCKIFDEFNQEVQHNYDIKYVINVTIRQRELAYEFDPLIAKYERGNSYFVKVIIKGTYEENGSVGPTYVNSSDISIMYALDKDFTKDVNTAPIPITSPGHTVVWARITAGPNIKPILTYAPVYLYENGDDDDDGDDTLPKEPHDAEDDPNVDFEKFKIYDGHPYKDPIYTGHQAEDRDTETKYYPYDYWKDCFDKGIPLDPSKAIKNPTNVGDYVFVFDVEASPDGTDPAHHYEQVFRIKPKHVKAEWQDLIVYIPTGKTRLDEPKYPSAKFLTTNGTYED
ncbi:MAG: hypothetical protein K2H06_03655, partial [Anaeroplasmataceae bacterium]|nr:hypothetical protein [Anaeroplasmataceae bacterium]